MKRTASLLAALIVSTSLNASAQNYTVVSPVREPKEVHIQIESIYDFEKELSLKIRRDTSLIPSDQLIKMVEQLDLRDGNGVAIRSGWDIDPLHDVVIGFSGGTAEIIQALKNAKGVQIITSFKDKNGNFVTPPLSQLSVTNAYGEKLCYDYEDVTMAAPSMRFTILLDRSGSMQNVIEDVKRVAYEFIDMLPDTAYCEVGSFADDLTWHFTGTTAACKPENFRLGSIKAGGSTKVFRPLLDTYKKMEAYPHSQKAVILITDGVASYNILGDFISREELHAHKKDTLTFLYWLGAYDESDLKDLTDNYTHHQGSIRRNLERYFNVLAGAYTKQRAITVRPCDKKGN
ncbi:MAG: hypothetical protein CO093_08565 [Alphaproteobacteria bacterium CG_4_9_14_3_um_filter_47_13]|nr:MAG: hypothetical protein CO093_08565 [Alphaproteobacteria bacterium CG_4_9_14_3_um_filter_47_13]